MIAVIFEVWPAEGERQHYLDLAAALRADLERIDGFLSVERFQSLTEPAKLLSLSFWRDEEAVRAWRNRRAPPRDPGQGPRRRLRRLPPPRRQRAPRLRHDRARRGPGGQPRRPPGLTRLFPERRHRVVEARRRLRERIAPQQRRDRSPPPCSPAPRPATRRATPAGRAAAAPAAPPRPPPPRRARLARPRAAGSPACARASRRASHSPPW